MDSNPLDEFTDLESELQKEEINNINNPPLKKITELFKLENSPKINIIQLCAITDTMKYVPKLNGLKTDIFSFIYNNFRHADKFEYTNPDKIQNKNIQTFNEEYVVTKDEKIDKLAQFSSFIKNNLLLFTYRFDFNYIYSVSGDKLTNDCGWGCMIRSCQMLLSACILKRKLYDSHVDLNDVESHKKLKNETAMLFIDNSILKDCVLHNKDFSHFWEKLNIKDENDINYFGLVSVIPPFSIQTICKICNMAGKFTSDLKVIASFVEINKQFFGEKDMFLYIPGCNINTKVLYESFCKIKEPNEDNFNLLNDNSNKLFTSKNKEIYVFNKPGIIFLSFKFGLDVIDRSLIPIIPDLLKTFRNNCGFVSGKNNRAYYFFGIGNDKLLCLDPHLCQKSIFIKNKIMDLRSYDAENVYLIDIKKISAELSVGIVINNEDDLSNFIEDYGKMVNKYPKNFNLY